jgi:hydrogenase maturation protein HypF
MHEHRVRILRDRNGEDKSPAQTSCPADPSPAPLVIKLGTPLRRSVLAMGADMKNSIAGGYGSGVELSAHTGDLDIPEGMDHLEHAARDLRTRLGGGPDVVAVDLHPDMRSTRLGRRLAAEWNLPVVEVQHHHAHAAACLAEHQRQEGLVLVMDGTGWGGDGTIWGAEVLELKGNSCCRRASFLPVPLPGGDAAVRRPARQVIGRWVEAGIQWNDCDLQRLGVTSEEAEVWRQQCGRRINAPLTHAAGRLFDAFSAVLGLAPREIAHEGEPAIRLEAAARAWAGDALPDLPFGIIQDSGFLQVDWAPAFRCLYELRPVGDDAVRWAMAIHAAIARAATAMITFALGDKPERWVGLSGGVFMNRILNDLLERDLDKEGVRILRHRKTLPGDGCIALGQALVAGRAEG